MILDFIAGCMGGLVGTIVGHPADTVKVRIQAQNPTNIKYRGTIHCFMHIIKNESVLGLYKGILAPMYSQITINAIIFGIHGNMTRSLKMENELPRQFISGAFAGFTQSFVTSPVELAKIRMQLQGQGKWEHTKLCYKNQPYGYTSPIDSIRKIYRHENGIRGIYRGLCITLARDIPAFSIYFGSYFFFCNMTSIIEHEHDISSLPLLIICGGTAGIMSWTLTYPQDTIKTRLQADGMGKNMYQGTLGCAKMVYREAGVEGFFKGFSAALIRAFPTNGATFATVTLFLSYMLPPVDR